MLTISEKAHALPPSTKERRLLARGMRQKSGEPATGSVFHRDRKRGLPAITISMSGNDNERLFGSSERKGGEKVAMDTLRVSRSIGHGGGRSDDSQNSYLTRTLRYGFNFKKRRIVGHWGSFVSRTMARSLSWRWRAARAVCPTNLKLRHFPKSKSHGTYLRYIRFQIVSSLR